MKAKLTHPSFFFLIAMANVALAAQITKVEPARASVWLSSPVANEFRRHDQVCAYQNHKEALCGAVAGIRGRELWVKVSSRNWYPRRGSRVALLIRTRRPASTESVMKAFEETHQSHPLDISAGVTAGTNYYYPMVQIQLAVADKFSLGVKPMFASYTRSNASLTAYGGYLTADYYSTHYAFKGLYFEGGLGVFSIKETSAGVSANTSPLGALGAVGWRGKALGGLDGLDIGVEAGLQYIFLRNSPIDISFRGLLPLVSAYLGYSF